MSTRVLIIDDHQLLREGLRSLLEPEADIVIVGEAGDGRTGTRLAQELQPDVVIMDIALPGLNGVEATRQLRECAPAARVIGLSAHANRTTVLQMLQAGASGYLPKSSAFDELVVAIRAVMADRSYLSPQVAGLVIGEAIGRASEREASAFTVLSAREREVLQLLAEGKSSREIGDILFISQKTVDVHRQHLMEKLNLHSLADLVKYAIREGLVALE